jgi:hypothetical protein
MKKEIKLELKELNNEIKDARKMVRHWYTVINKAEKRQDDIYEQLQKSCKHPKKYIKVLLYEYDYSGDSDHISEKRVCSLCGYSEIGKTTGIQGVYEFKKLKCDIIRGPNGNVVDKGEYNEMSKVQIDLGYKEIDWS